VKVYNSLDLHSSSVVLGNHAVWIPDAEIKVPFQWGGLIKKRTYEQPATAIRSLLDEIHLLKYMASMNMAPPIGDIVYFKNLISDYPGAWHCDPCGAYGYEMIDARKLPPGKFDAQKLKDLGWIKGSEAAWGDLTAEQNIINGYAVDVRRTDWDMLTLAEGAWDDTTAEWYSEPVSPLEERVARDCQFPAGSRPEPYQDYWIGPLLRKVDGQRRVEERAEQLLFRPDSNTSVLDLGTQTGSMLQYAWRKQRPRQGRLAGIEHSESYLNCARDLARSCSMNINYVQADLVGDYPAFLEWARAYYPGGIDHLLILSMEKHIGDDHVFRIIDDLKPKRAYIETNAVPEGKFKLREQVEARQGTYLGDSTDRNRRNLYLIEDNSD
jgi:hypothetical protein